MNKLSFLSMLVLAAAFIGCNQKPEDPMKLLIDDNFNFAAAQYKLLAGKIPADRMPKHYDAKTDSMYTTDTKWWCSGFFPGTLWHIFEQTKDETIKKEAEARLAILEKEKHFTDNHDLGFMMFCSFGTAYRITGNAKYKPTIDTAAASLATRYRPSIQSIQSWNKGGVLNCPVIIDNMMNLELLYWVSENGGDSKFRDIAINHSNSTLQHHFREDNSSWHVLDYDLEKGEIIKKITWQGAADSSAWARGQAWGLYGFTSMYRMSRDIEYLKQAHKIADFLLSHPRLPEDMIPYWDFDATDIPNTYRDASAGAIIASALLELAQFSATEDRDRYVTAATKMLTSLSSDAYRAKPGENGGFLLMHSVGALPFNSEVDVPLTYADYYFLEGLKRYKDWYL